MGLGMTESELDRRALLVEAELYGVDLLALGAEQPNGSVTLDWDVLAEAVAERRLADGAGEGT